MKAERLSKRLDQVAQMITQTSLDSIRLADIGSDHAYLPAYLALQDQIEWAIAGEVAQGPFQSAQATIDSYQLQDKIQARLGDGFEVVQVEDQINLATICGMGGSLIINILEGGYARKVLPDHLVLQANNQVPQLRRYLQGLNYQLIDEALVEEKGQIYQILQAQVSDQPQVLSDRQVFFGPFQLSQGGPIFTRYWQNELDHRLKIRQQMQGRSQASLTDQDRAKFQAIDQEITWIKEVLNDDTTSL